MGQTKKILQASFDAGYSVAGVVLDFIDYVDQKAKYPVKVCLRDGELFMHGAQKLSKLAWARFDFSKFGGEPLALGGGFHYINRLEKWDDVFLTRDICDFLDKELNEYLRELNMQYPQRYEPLKISASEEIYERKYAQLVAYLASKGVIDKNITLVDTGFRGSVAKALHKYNEEYHRQADPSAKKIIQSVFINGAKSVPLPNNFMSTDLQHKIRAGIDWILFESFPKKHETVQIDDLTDGNFNPAVVEGLQKECYDAFYEGVETGIEDLTKKGEKLKIFGGMPEKYYKKFGNEIQSLGGANGNAYTKSNVFLFGMVNDYIAEFDKVQVCDEQVVRVYKDKNHRWRRKDKGIFDFLDEHNAEIKDIYSSL